MLLYGAKARWANSRKFRPRHFALLTRALAPERVRWTGRLSDLPQGGWAMVIRAPGSHSLGRDMAARSAPGSYVFDRISADERRALERQDGVLVLDLGWDPLIPTDEVVDGLIQSIEAFGLPPSQIRLVHSNQDARGLFDAAWRRLTTLEPCADIAFPASLALGLAYQHAHRGRDQAAARIAAARQSLERGAKARKFNAFNGEFRPHRLHVLAFLHNEGLLDEGYVSMLGYSKTAAGARRAMAKDGSVMPAHIRAAMAKLPYSRQLAASVEAMYRRGPLALDIRGWGPGQWERTVWSSQAARYYDDSCFSVIVDSNSHRQDVLHVTEKIMKPMINGHPFLYMGNMGALARLRGLGFETFSPAFDETYDVTANMHERLRWFLDELKRLASKSTADLTELCLSLWPRLEHNHRHFWGEARDRLKLQFNTDVLDRLL